MIALELNQLKDEVKRYESCKYFLNYCTAEELNLRDLRLELRPKIGNSDQEFVEEQYFKLNLIFTHTNEKFIAKRPTKPQMRASKLLKQLQET